MKIVNMVMAAVFLFGAIVQINDPDPLPWIAVYLAATAACVMAARRSPPLWFPSAVSVVALLWALYIRLQARGIAPFGELFAQWEMRDEVIEETRETYGLIIIGVWMLVLAGQVLRARRKVGATAASGELAPRG